MPSDALTVEKLHKTYRLRTHEVHVLNGIDLRVRQGEWVALTGPSGCGKTTLLHLLGILDKVTAGTISWFDRDITRLGPFRKARIRRQELGFVFQNSQLFPELNALENVMIAGRLNGQKPLACRQKAIELIAKMGLEDRLAHHPTELSGGEQQRIAMARALINNPRVILADEPTGNLDQSNAREIMRLLAELRQEDKVTIVMVTHDRELAELADRTLVMQDGKLIKA